MITVKVPMRQLFVYQLDDGRRIEEYRKVGEVDQQFDETKDEVPSFAPVSSVYVGIVHVQTPHGPREVKFEIAECGSINDAFTKYVDTAHDAIKALQERAVKQSRQILTAPADALQALHPQQQQGGIVVP